MSDNADEIKKRYDVLAKKYSLPSFVELEKAFDLCKIEPDGFILRDIRKRIAERIDFFCKLLEEVLQPDTNISNLYESKYFDDDEKAKIFGAYKKLMKLNRETAELAIKNEEAEDAEFIKRLFSEMPALKAELLPIITKMKQSWERDTEESEKLGYFG